MIGKILKWGVIIIVVIFILSILFGGEKKPDKKPVCGDGSCDAGETTASCPRDCKEAEPGEEPKKIYRADVAETEAGWSKPIYVAASMDDHHEDSLWVSPDGKTLHFMDYKGNLFKDFAEKKFADDIDNWMSVFPFTTRTKVDKFGLSLDVASAAGAMIGGDGAWYYHSNHHVLKTGDSTDALYRNDEMIVSYKDRALGNPQYCVGKDELWYDDPQDVKGVFMKDAKKSNFKNPSQPTPYEGTQWWLSEDCMTAYFSANYGDIPSQGSGLYRIIRSGESWSKPVPVIWSKHGVAEGTLTADGKKLFFIGVIDDPKGGITTDMFYIERL